MPTPAISLKLRKFRRRFGVSAPRVVVRTHVSWRWYVVGGVLILILAFLILTIFVRQGEAGAREDEISTLQDRIRGLEDELLKMRAGAGTEQSLVQMERSAQLSLMDRLKALEAENGALKEDILLFERLVPPSGEKGAVRLDSFAVFPGEERHFRYRLVLAFQPGKQVSEFRGRLQFLVVFSQDGKRQELVMPTRPENSPEYQVEIRHFLRKEGGFELPSGARLVSVEVRLLQGDTLKAKQLAQL